MNSTSEWYSSTTISPNSEMITEAPETLPANMFCISGTEQNVLLDTGLGVGDLEKFVSDRTEGGPTRVVLSHTHWDHIGNAHQFGDISVHPAERGDDGSVRIDTLSDEFVQRPAQFVSNRRKQDEPFPNEFDPSSFSVPPTNEVGTVDSSDTILLGDRDLEVIPIPGHSPGHIALLDEQDQILYGADLVHVEKNAFLHFDDSSLDSYLDSLERVVDLYEREAFETLVTGHNPPLSDDQLNILYVLEDGLSLIAEGKLDGKEIETDWGPALEYKVGESTVLTKVSNP